MKSLYYSQVVMAASASAFLFVNAKLVGTRMPVAFYISAFLATWAIYLWDSGGVSSVCEDRVSQPGRAEYFARRPWLAARVAPMTLMLAGMILLPFVHRVLSAFLLGALGAAGLSYVFHLIPTSRRFRRVKEVPFLKIFVITLAWLGGGLGLPLAFRRFWVSTPAAPLGVLTGVQATLLFLDTLALDCRDREGDRAQGVVTLARWAGRGWVQAGAWTLVAIWLAAAAGLDVVDARFTWGVGAMVCVFGLAALGLRHFERNEIAYGLLVAAWRFVGCAVLLAC